MDYEVIPDFLYLNEPIYRRVTGVPQARLVSSVLSVNAEPASQHGIYPWAAAARARASEPDIITQLVPHPRYDPRTMSSDYGDFVRNRISRADGERLVSVGYTAEGMQGVLDPVNVNRVYYQRRWSLPASRPAIQAERFREFSRLGTLVRHFLRSGHRNVETELFFSENPNNGYSVGSLFYDPLPDVPTTATAPAPAPAPAPSSGFRRQGGYKRSSTTNRNKKLIRRTRRQNRSRK